MEDTEDFTLTSSVALPPVEETVSEFLLRKVGELAEMGKEDWIIDVVTGESHSYQNFEDETRRVASFFYKHGMRKGDTIIYMTYDMVKIHILMTGVWLANGTVRASYPEDDEETLLSRVEESRVGWILCEPGAVAMCQNVAEKIYWDVEIIVSGEGEVAEGCLSYNQILEDDGSEMPKLKVTPDDPALILCTSGTTGRSKGAVHSHRGVVNTLLAMGLYGPFLDESPNLIVSKATHITGALFPLALLSSGKMALVMSVISKSSLFQSVHIYKVKWKEADLLLAESGRKRIWSFTSDILFPLDHRCIDQLYFPPGFIWGFPTFLLLMVNDPEAGEYDFSSLVIAASGGAQITPSMQKSLMELPNLEAFLNLYGLTEACPVAMVLDCSTCPSTKFEDVPPFSVGKVPVGTSIQIRDPETGEVLGPNQKGEICVKTECIFACYLNNPEATEDAFIDKTWFKTGDLGYYDENEFIFLVDRMKEIFKYFNNHVSPTELEDVINQHEAVNEVCVFGIEDPEGGGSIPRAVVTLKNGQDATAEDILEFANGKLPDYKRLRGGLFILNDLPKGKTGKVTRNLAAQLDLSETD